MPLYKCHWEDGDVSFVLAASEEQAIAKLQAEVGDVGLFGVTPVKDFLVTLTPGAVLQDDEGVSEPFWDIGELGDCMSSVLSDQFHEEAGCVGCSSYDPTTDTCGAQPDMNGKAADFETPIRMASFGEMPIPPEEQEGLSQVLENLCHQISKGSLPAANQLVAVIHADHPAGARGLVLHRDDVKGGTPRFPLVFVESALGLPVPEPESLLVMVSTSNGIGSFVVGTTEVIRSTQERAKAPMLYRTRSSSAVN
jgi:hypothetical protein